MNDRIIWLGLILLVVFYWSPSEAVGRKAVKDKIETPRKEITETPSILYGSDQKESLKGLKGIGILVEPLNPDLEPTGLSRSQIQQAVEWQLTQAGIGVLSPEERLKEPGKPYLYINLNAYSWREEVIYGYSLKVELNQLVLLDRQRMTGCFGTTWQAGSAGIVGANKFGQVIKMELSTALDQFIKDYKEVNKGNRP